MTDSDGPRLVSIGYEGRDLQDLVQLLLCARVDTLVDVRLNPISRKRGLSKMRLSEELRSHGINYVHLPELGNPKDNRDAFRAGDERAVKRFRSLLREANAERALGRIADRLDREVVALLCYERRHAECHRGLIAEALATQLPELAVDPS